jgi:Cu(I)/Ag(I) efflux system membrane fusion protein
MNMNPRKIGIAALLIGLLLAAGYALYASGVQHGIGITAGSRVEGRAVRLSAAAGASHPAAPEAASEAPPQSIAQGEEATRRHIQSGLKAGDLDPLTGSRILYYRDPMMPASKFDKPAKSPYMDMMLVPVYADGDSDASRVTISPRIQQSLGVRTALVSEGPLAPQVAAVGSIAFNEREQVVIQARAAGYVERLRVRATLDRVTPGQALAELYVPDWIAAQEEFLSVRRMRGTGLAPLDGLVEGARQRMRQLGMSEAQIARVADSGQTQPRITVSAPIGGVVTELSVREGMSVAPGATLFRINGLGTVWANAEVPESQVSLLRPGMKVKAWSPAAPGVVFEGQVQALLPEVNPATRTLKARVELANAKGALVPGLFVEMQFQGGRQEKVLQVPTEALIQTGSRSVVMLAEEGGRFRPVAVEIGIESGGQTEIRRGLQAGQRVVVSSQFLIDSEASFRGTQTRLSGDAAPSAAREGAAP